MNLEAEGTQIAKPANAERIYHVKRSDLPVSCPMPDMVLWSAHPKVYLPLEETGRAICPYCSAEFVLEGKEQR